jgi:YD repeat-containing protein
MACLPNFRLHHLHLDRPTTVTNPLSQTITTAYDLVDNVISVTDALNRTTQLQRQKQKNWYTSGVGRTVRMLS